MVNYEIAKEIKDKGIDLNLAVWEITHFKVLTESYSLNTISSKIRDDVLSNYTLGNLKENPIISLYRTFYWRFLNIDPTKIRPASEALIRRILNGKPLPKISPMVDAYNWGSIRTHISMGAYDLDKIQGSFQIRFSREGERYLPVSKKNEKVLSKKVIVNADNNSKIMCQYPYQDA